MSLSLIKTWIFDLDNTLYPPEENIFSQIDQKMTSFIADNLKISNEEAFNIQKQNFIDHGTTLAGFMNSGNDKIDPDKFLEFVHDINLNSLQEDNNLRKILLLLPGKKYIFTNGTKKHAENVLKKLNLENIFQSIFGIKEANYLPKPNLETYNLFLKTYKIDPKTSIMFEDMGRNLIPAKELGMKTVLLERKLPNKNNSDQEDKYKDLWNDNYDADYIIDDIVKFLNNEYS
ncbi:MAG: pyrimidine 5'-nucleotidase [Rhizobiales bacterium TMED94]|nr:pyrimidine 5'-nucleotidase [Rhodobiaceae bacterium]RPF89459.1 MAG: pyrimidine 5'-nucleotidase [Rhizobiales bacterium TMED94]